MHIYVFNTLIHGAFVIIISNILISFECLVVCFVGFIIWGYGDDVDSPFQQPYV